MDSDFDSDEDTEVQLDDINRLTAILEADKPSTSTFVSQYSQPSSRAHTNTETDTDSDEDTEIELKELHQLTAVLQAEEPYAIAPAPRPSESPVSAHANNSKSSSELSKINEAITLNKMIDKKYRLLEVMLESRLSECTQKLDQLDKTEQVIEKSDVFRPYMCGKPYFRDKLGFSPPDNEDTIIMAKSQMFDLSHVQTVPGWTVKDKSEFILEIHKMSQDVRRNELQSKIRKILRENTEKDSMKTQKLVAALSEDIIEIKNKSLNDLALPLEEEYDWELLANRLNRRHTAQEYRALWRLFFHPIINKNSWTKSEHIALQKIASAHKFEDWDAIAQELDTGRTGYQCFVYFRTNMSHSANGKKWSKEEIEYLKRLVDFYKEDKYIPWGKVAAGMENRTKIQIYNKYLRLVEDRKGRFVPEEDAVILNCIDKFGHDFKRMMNYLPGRSIVQIRARFNVLNKMTMSTVWTAKEDRQLVQLIANQDSNVNYASISKFFPGKDRVNIRSRYIILEKWMKKHPNVDIGRAPRRGARRLTHGQANENLNKAIENLKKRMQSEVQENKSRRITKKSSETDIEDAIVTTLYNEIIQEEELKESDEKWEEQLELHNNDSVVASESLNITNLRKMLLYLNAKLDRSLYNSNDLDEQYPGLAEAQEVCSVNVKSYSRKNRIRTIEINKHPDIWGHKTIGQLKYVLPPNYSTITGCRALVASVNQKRKYVVEHGSNINVLMKRNQLLRDQYDLLLERFNALFIWPMLLSNEAPNIDEINARKLQGSHNKSIAASCLAMNVDSGLYMKSQSDIAIPIISKNPQKVRGRKKKIVQDSVDGNIDLMESNQKDTVTLKEDLSESRLE